MLVHIGCGLLARLALEERVAAQPGSRVDSQLTCKVVTNSGEQLLQLVRWHVQWFEGC